MKKVIFVNLIAIIAIITFSEILIRYFELSNLRGYGKDIFYSENGITLTKPNIKTVIFGKDVLTDKNGFRIPLKRNSHFKELDNTLILGDSVSFGVGVKEELTFIGNIRKKNKHNFYNASVSGHNLESYLYLISKYNKDLDVKFNNTIIFLCLNDIIFYQGVISQKDILEKFKEKGTINRLLKNPILMKVGGFFRDKLTTFNFLKDISTNPPKRYFENINWLYQEKKLLIDYKNHINKINNYSRLNDLNVKFVLLPYAYQIKNNCEKKYMLPQQQINKIFKELNIKLHDFSQNFCINQKNEKLFLNYDPVHLSIYGHQFVSSLLIKNKIID